MRTWLLLVCCVLSFMDNIKAQAPVFTSPDPNGGTTITLNENTAISTSVLQLIVNSGTPTTFSIVSATPANIFTISTATVRTSATLDFETYTSYTIIVKADNGQTSTATFVLQVRDLNDEVPQLRLSNTYTATIAEELATGTYVMGPFGVTDKDAGDTRTFSFTGSHVSYFNLDPSTGTVTVGQRLDRDTLSFSVFNQLFLQVTDAAGYTLASAQQLIITLTDINDNAPSCTPVLYSTSIPENTVSATTVLTLTCADSDIDAGIGDVSTYVIASGDDAAGSKKFSGSGANILTTSVLLDYETKTSYTLLVNVADGGTPAKTGTATVLVFVTNVNDNTPAWGTFTPPGNSHTVSESAAAGSSIVKLTATDGDSGVEGQISYSLVSTNAASVGPVSGVFQVDSASGQVVTSSGLNAEVSGSYTLVVRATDGGSPARSVDQTLTVTVNDVNDNSPTFTPSTYSFAITETNARAMTWPGGQLTASDADITTAPLLYQISGGDTLNKFKFSSTTKGLLELNAAIDVDKPAANPSTYVLIVQASDQGVPNTPAKTGSATVTITITSPTNDHPPVFGTPVPSASPSISESVPLGTSVASLPVTDKDMVSGAAQSIAFAITGGNANINFIIDSALGVVYTAKALDFETTISYTLQIEASDNGTPSLTGTISLSITVVNVNEYTPACPAYNLFAVVDEAVSGQPSVVKTIGCTDGDTSDTLTYSIVPANPSFTINGASGQLSTILALDYETATTHTLLVKVQDTLTPVKSTTVTLTVLVQPVNEQPPVFAPASYTARLAEGVPVATSVTTLSATDTDRGAKDGTIRYSITAGNGLGAFTVDYTTGAVTTTAVGLDRETRATHVMTVSACDDIAGAVTEHCVTASVTVSVTDVNDNKPACVPQNYQARVTEPSVVGAVVATLTALDDDEAGTPNSTPFFTVIGGDVLPPSSYFSTSGSNLILSRTVDYESLQSYFLTLKVTDGGTPALSSTCQVTVTIISSNEYSPVTTVPNYSMTLTETTATGTVVYDVDATDADKGNGSVIRYDITSGNTNNDFFCYPDSGTVIVWNALDYDTPPQTYNLTVSVSDDGGLKTDFWLSVSLTDVNDQTPIFTRVVYSVTTDENVALGTEVVKVKAVDTDSGPDGTVTYLAVSGDGIGLFSVHPGTGSVTTSAVIDREARRSYSLVVRGSDSGTPSLSSTTLVDITVTDLNDNAPQFTPKDFTISVSESDPVTTSVTTMTAADADTSASNNVFTYVLTDNFFGVNSATGVVSVKQALDRETNPRHILEVVALDAGAPSLTGTATITVILTDVNDNRPVVVGTYTPQVSEDAAVDTIVTVINATDADYGDNARLTYTIISGNTNNDFIISNVNGYIQVRNALDRERTLQYNLEVLVNDNGIPKLSATTTVTITISDVNDNAPVFSAKPYSFSVNENLAAGQVVGRVTATDSDLGVNADLVYSVVLFFTGSLAHFALDGATGVITTTTPLDRETTAQYVAWMRVTDSGSPQLHDDVNVTIAVADLNDNAPVFDRVTYTASTVENSPVGTGVLTVAVSDNDIGSNAAVTLAIDTSKFKGLRASQFLQVTSGTGVISVKSVIDRETDAVFTFVLLAYDAGTPSLTSSATVTVSVIDVNDNAPVFTKTYYNEETAYAAQCTRSIVTVTATDADTGLNGQVSYFLTTAANSFLVDAVTGELSLQAALTQNVMYSINVSARDGGSPVLTSTNPVLIRVDAFVPNNVAVTFKLGITVEAFLPMQNTFLSQLQVIMRQLYPTAVAKLWCAETNSNGLADVHVYFLSDNTTETVANSNEAKYFVSQSNARGAYTSQPSGEPNAALAGSEWSAFNIKSVQPYAETQTPYAQTAEGIGVITACCVIGLVLLVAGAYMGARYCRQQAKNLRGQPKRQILVEERRRPARNEVKPSEEKKYRPPPPSTGNSNKPLPMGRAEVDFFWNGSSKP